MAAEENAFLQSVKAHFEQMRDASVLSTIRQKAWDRFISIGLPSRDENAFRSVSLRELYAASFPCDNAHTPCPETIAQEMRKCFCQNPGIHMLFS